MIDQQVLGDTEVSEWIKKSKTIQSVTRLPGDASTRKYYRVLSNPSSFILMSMDPFVEPGHDLPFLAVQKHLRGAGIDVPEVLDVDPQRGFILLEDLGDVTLLKKLQTIAHPDPERYLYEKVIDGLVDLQVKASPQSRSKQKGVELEAFKLRFDHEKLMWEVNFTLDNFYNLYLKREMTNKDRKIMIDGFSGICTYLAAQPTVLTHRDFHSRNIMVTQAQEAERFVMIDFQDARMGPPQYDLASLLRDSYYQLEDRQISTLIDYYIGRFEAMSGRSINRDQFTKVFDLMSVQRNFKAIGSFASFMNRRGNASYLKYIGNTFENIRRNLLKYPEYGKLRETLFNYYYF